MADYVPQPLIKKWLATGKMNRRGQGYVILLFPGPQHLCRPVDLPFQFNNVHLPRFSPLLIAMAAPEITTLG
jgi:hypothetical protein